jgi:hypothetical protein
MAIEIGKPVKAGIQEREYRKLKNVLWFVNIMQRMANSF